MSLIYPTNNSPNESPGRARNALGRSACALVVAGALVLPLTPAGAVTDPGASTPASTATVTPQVVADQEPQATPQLVVETPDEVNPYYGKTLKIKGTGFYGVAADQQVSLKVTPSDTPANSPYFTTEYGVYNLGYVNVPASQIHDGTFEVYLNTQPLPLNDFHPELDYVVTSTLTSTTQQAQGYEILPTTAYNTQAPVLVARQNTNLEVEGKPNSLVEDSVKVRGTGYDPKFIPQGGYLQVSLIEGDWPRGQVVTQERTVSSVKVSAEELSQSGLFETALPYPAGLDARRSYRIGTQVINPDGTLANNALTEYLDVEFSSESKAPQLNVSVPAVNPTADTEITVTGTGYYGSGNAEIQGQSMNLVINEIDQKTGKPTGAVLTHPVDYTYRVEEKDLYDGFTDGTFQTTFTIPANTLKTGHVYELSTGVYPKDPKDDVIFEAHQKLPLTTADQPVPNPKPAEPQPGPEPAPNPKPAPGEKPTPESDFKDVRDRTAHRDAILWASQRQLVDSADGYYRPYDAITREQSVVALYRLAGSPQVTLPQESPYVDVTPEHPHYREIIWARESGISFGWSDGHFRPEAAASHASMAAFLYRYAGEPGVNLPEQSLYADMTADSPFYRESTWLKKRGLVFWSENWFQPDGAVTRADFAELIYQYEQGK